MKETMKALLKRYWRDRINLKLTFAIGAIPTPFIVLMYGYPNYEGFIGYVFISLSLLLFWYAAIFIIIAPLFLINFYFFYRGVSLDNMPQWLSNICSVLLLVWALYVGACVAPIYSLSEAYLMEKLSGFKSGDYIPGDEQRSLY